MPRCAPKQKEPEFTKSELDFLAVFKEWCEDPSIQERGYMHLFEDEIEILERTRDFSRTFEVGPEDEDGLSTVRWRGGVRPR